VNTVALEELVPVDDIFSDHVVEVTNMSSARSEWGPTVDYPVFGSFSSTSIILPVVKF